MVKLIIENKYLYLEIANRKQKLESATIYQDKSGFKVVVFPGGKSYIQKTDPIPKSIVLEYVKEFDPLMTLSRGMYYTISTKNFYINKYVKNWVKI